MTCKQLGGACDKVFRGDTFEEIAQQSKAHGSEMYKAEDAAHLQAMQKMKTLMLKPEEMQAWYVECKSQFEALPED